MTATDRFGGAQTGAEVRPQIEVPLCVDLDGTLLKTDSFFECLLAILRKTPLTVLRLLPWLLHGKAVLKRKVAESAILKIEELPVQEEVLEAIAEAKQAGRQIILVTGADERIAAAVAAHFDLFDSWQGSDGRTNLTGAEKADYLVQRFGVQGFDYIGNDRSDLKVWRLARRAIVAGPSERLVAGCREIGRETQRLVPIGEGAVWRCLGLLRIHQWCKNLLLFVPLMASHTYWDVERWLACLEAFVAMSLCASSAYLLNDLMDVSADRAHPTKRKRAIAAGDVSIASAIVWIPVLCVGGFAVGILVGRLFVGLLTLYLVVTTGYSLFIKRLLLWDVISLAGLYALRVVMGAAAIDVPISEWLLAFSMFFFLSLALAKRYAEVHNLGKSGNREVKGRSYESRDRESLALFGTASAYLSVLVMALYVNGQKSAALYSRPEVLWLVCPLFLFWLSRIWIITGRGGMSEDPIAFAIRDRTSYAIIAVVGLLALAAGPR